MRWDALTLDSAAEPSTDGPQQVLPVPGAVVRTFDTPGFRDMTFFEIRSRSVLNKVPEASRVPFRWTVNPYRGCSHACVYCFARNTHTYLDLNAGLDFDRKVIVKVNAPERLRQELAAPRWRHEHVALGTNVDPYQRAEGRYQLMPGIISALRDSSTPFSILTKGSLILRDLDLLVDAARRVDVGLNVSVGSVDRELWRTVEPGTPSPHKRLEVCKAFTAAGVGCGVLMAPVLPYLSDSDEQLEATVAAIAEAGASFVSPLVLHLRSGAREWFMQWLATLHPELVAPYDALYGGGAYAPKAHQRELTQRVTALAEKHGVGRRGPRMTRPVRPPPPVDEVAADAEQMQLPW